MGRPYCFSSALTTCLLLAACATYDLPSGNQIGVSSLLSRRCTDSNHTALEQVPKATGFDSFYGIPAPEFCVHASSPHKVVVIVLDGVGTQDLYRSETLPFLKRGIAQLPGKTLYLGDSSRWETQSPERQLLQDFLKQGLGAQNFCRVSQPFLETLPAYADLLSGIRQSSITSDSGTPPALTYPTLADRLVESMALSPEAIAFFPSWKPIAAVLSRNPQPKFKVDLSYSGQQSSSEATTDRVLEYLGNNTPQFLVISFRDSDASTLFKTDQSIKRIINTLEKQPTYKNQTSYLITTDRGRAEGSPWGVPSEKIWAILHSPHLDTHPLLLEAWQHSACTHTQLGKLILAWIGG